MVYYISKYSERFLIFYYYDEEYFLKYEESAQVRI